jgi:hypothetical protein
MSLDEKEIARILEAAKRADTCFRCGSQPTIVRDERLGKFFARCPKCKDMSFSAILLDAATHRWNETNLWRKRTTEISIHNDTMRARGARQLPSSVEEANALNSLRK